MCTGAEFLIGVQAAAAAYGGYAAYSATKREAPNLGEVAPIVKTDPVQDDTEAQTKAAQDAQLQKLVARERSRANSLLSQAGGAGDPTGAPLGRAEGKPTFGS